MIVFPFWGELQCLCFAQIAINFSFQWFRRPLGETLSLNDLIYNLIWKTGCNYSLQHWGLVFLHIWWRFPSDQTTEAWTKQLLHFLHAQISAKTLMKLVRLHSLPACSTVLVLAWGCGAEMFTGWIYQTVAAFLHTTQHSEWKTRRIHWANWFNWVLNVLQ